MALTNQVICLWIFFTELGKYFSFTNRCIRVKPKLLFFTLDANFLLCYKLKLTKRTCGINAKHSYGLTFRSSLGVFLEG